MEERIDKGNKMLPPDTIKMVQNRLNYKTKERRRSNIDNPSALKTTNIKKPN